MPTKFRFLPDSDSSHAAESAVETPRFVSSDTAGGAVKVDVDETSPQVESGSDLQPEFETNERPVSGLHEIIKNTDFTFNMNLSGLEKFAVYQAGAHAQAGLPRQQVITDEELSIESVFRGRASELFLDWAARVRRRVQDAIHSSCVNAGEGIVKLRHELDELEVLAGQIADKTQQVREYEKETAGEEKTFEYLPLLGRIGYWSLLTVLTLVDWVANLPVFGQLLPQEPGADQRWAELLASNERYGHWAGFMNLFSRIQFAPEISLFAVGVVVFLMFLAHVTGQSVRQLVAFWPRNEGQTVIGLQSYRRQAWFPAVASSLGVLLVISFLFIARGNIKSAANNRREEAAQQVQYLTTRFAVETGAQSASAVDTSAALEDAKQREKDLTQTYNYASSISQMNGSIALLNIVLAIVAACAAYLHDSRHIGDTRFSDPRVAPLEMRLSALRTDVDGKRHQFRATDSAIQTSLAQARYLSQSFPLRDWPAKAERLNGVIPLFRAENARQRGIDVQNILAFREEVRLQLPAINENDPFVIPVELPVWEQEFSRLRQQIQRVDMVVSRAKIGGSAIL